VDVFESLHVNHWAGLIDAAAVLLVLGVWLLIDASFAFLRAVLRVAGAALLVAAAGVVVQRAVGLVHAGVLRETFAAATGEESTGDRSLVVLGVAAVALVAGVVLATLGAEDDDEAYDADLDDEEEDDEPVPAPVAPPPSAWSRTEVLGDAPERGRWDPDPEPEPSEPLGLTPRAHAVPLLALAVALALPTASRVGEAPLDAMPFLGDLGVLQAAGHAMTGLLAGLALLGGVLALGVDERRVVVPAFALTAIGAGLGGAFLPALANEHWVAGATGAMAGLLLPSGYRVLRRLPAASRGALVTGVLGAAALLAASMFLRAHAVKALFEEQFLRF